MCLQGNDRLFERKRMDFQAGAFSNIWRLVEDEEAGSLQREFQGCPEALIRLCFGHIPDCVEEPNLSGRIGQADEVHPTNGERQFSRYLEIHWQGWECGGQMQISWRASLQCGMMLASAILFKEVG